MDQATNAFEAETLETEGDRRPRPFGRQALAPACPIEEPADFDRGPTFGIVQAEPADERARRLLLDGPHAVAPQLPMTQEHGQRAPRVGPREERARADVPHRLRIGAHPRIVVEVGLDELAEFQSFGLECFVHGTPSRLTRTLAPSRGDLPVSAIRG